MQRQALLLLVAAVVVLCVGAILVPQFLAGDDPTLLRWSQTDELDVPNDEADPSEAAAVAGSDRSVAAVADADALRDPENRVDVLLRGRVVDKFRQPVAAAKVWLDFGRAGQRGGPPARQRRVPDPVQTDPQGRFAFQGQTFRNLQVSLQVQHPSFAPGLFEKSLGEVGQRGSSEIELGDLVMARGAELVGRVTDLDGNGIAGTKLTLQPENGNRLRFLRNRDELLPTFVTDNNGFYRRANVAAGDWSVTATAKMHTEGRSPVFACEDEQTVELDDIRLGPGYELTGWVRDAAGAPIDEAEVVLRSEGNERPGRGERGGRGDVIARFTGREHRATTDAEGRFFVEHLPGSPMTLDATAAGHLDAKLTNVDPTLGQPVVVTMQEGLRITGLAVDEDASPVESFAVRALRMRGLADPAAPGQASPPTRGGFEAATREMRVQFEQFRQRGEGDARGPGQRPGQFLRDLGKVGLHPRGEFTLDGLQEGIYEVHLQSNDHARYRSAEVELRAGLAAPHVTAKLDRGVYVAGVCVDPAGNPVREARVALRPSSPEPPTGGAGGQRDRAQDFARRIASAMGSVETTTDAEGVFVLKHVPRATYRLQAEADGFAAASSETFELTADRSGFTLTLGPLGAIAGKVLGLATNELAQARVAAVPTRRDGQGGGGMFRGGGFGGPGFRDVGVAADGTYRIEDLEPGDYIVRSWIGSPQNLMRELMPKFLEGSLGADVAVRANEVVPLDVPVTRPQVGIVTGSVLHNGAPANGFRVELTPNDASDSAATANPERRGRNGGNPFRNFGANLQATVQASGQFKIADVPAGSYTLRVTAARRGGTLHEELVDVAANVTTERSIAFATYGVAGNVTVEDGSDPKTLVGNVSLLPGLTALPEDLGRWRRENTTFDARVQNGAFRIDALKPGNYLVMLSIRGRERTTTQLSVGPGAAGTLLLKAGKVAEPGATERPSAPRPGQPQPR